MQPTPERLPGIVLRREAEVKGNLRTGELAKKPFTEGWHGLSILIAATNFKSRLFSAGQFFCICLRAPH